jgi:glycosyltransferase involved in cell wall biosynthesis
MYRRITEGLGPEYTEKFQFISSRVRQLVPGKKKILILNDTWDDPESAHLSNELSRNRFDHLVFVSNYQFQTYNLGLGVPYNGSSVIRNAIVPFGDVNKPDDGKINLIYHTTPHRGLELLIPVFIEIAKLRPNVHLDIYSSFEIYGWGHRDAPYQALFDLANQHPQITSHGAVSNDSVRVALSKAHIFAYPNIWPETSCIAAIEAMAAGCAVVAPDYGALPETLSSYGFSYRWNEDHVKHMTTFANFLLQVIDNYHSPMVQENLTLQKRYANSQYNIRERLVQWRHTLDRL